MKRLRLQRWGSECLRPRIPPPPRSSQCRATQQPPCLRAAQSMGQSHQRRHYAARAQQKEEEIEVEVEDELPNRYFADTRAAEAKSSAKLSALHARLSLPSRYPTSTLARALVHPTADANTHRNNESLAILGSDLLGYYSAEHILCHYPRIPVSIMFSAQWAFIGPKALAQMSYEWGVEHVAEPGAEVDPGLLQCRHPQLDPASLARAKEADAEKQDPNTWTRGMSWRIMSEDLFGELPDNKTQSRRGRQQGRLFKQNPDALSVLEKDAKTPPTQQQNETATDTPVVTLEDARASFVRALIGGLYFHSGRLAVSRFFTQHILSRHLDLSTLFDFKNANLDLSRLCARENFEPPRARLISESGRLSRHPVFVVGVYSGADELGQGAGASLDEARMRASAAALRSWYLYSPLEVTKPSSVEGTAAQRGQGAEGRRWVRNLVDVGEVVT